MSRFSKNNDKKNSFLATRSLDGLDTCNITDRCKFNFSYFTNNQDAGSDFCDLSIEELTGLIERIKEFSREPLSHWTTTKAGSGSCLEIYQKFPERSDFAHPPHIPHDVHWARFRINKTVRLAGFVIPTEFRTNTRTDIRHPYDLNTFYAVFLDLRHRFYITRR